LDLCSCAGSHLTADFLLFFLEKIFLGMFTYYYFCL
jgi:hypothetical protein